MVYFAHFRGPHVPSEMGLCVQLGGLTSGMVTRHRLSRRSFLTEFAGGTTAVAIFGLAACSSGSSTSTVSTDSSSAGSSSASSSSAGSASTESSSPVEGGTATDATSLAWERVNLGFVSAYVLARGSDLAVVDTGVSGSEGDILSAIETLGGQWGDVQHVILTHAHGDHTGSLEAILSNAPGAAGHAGTADLGKISAQQEINGLEDGDEVFGLQIIGTPGHTPGHISVYDETSAILLAGDAMNGEDGGIAGANPRFTEDMDLASESIKRLSSRTVDTVLFGHGEPVVEDAQAALVALAESL